MYHLNQKGIIQAVLVVIVVVAGLTALGMGIYLNNLVKGLDSSGSGNKEGQNTPFTDIPIISKIPQFVGGSAATPVPTAKPAATAKPEATVKPAVTPTPTPSPAKTESCPKVETLACFSTSPICKKFPSPCEVPSGWRIVSN